MRLFLLFAACVVAVVFAGLSSVLAYDSSEPDKELLEYRWASEIRGNGSFALTVGPAVYDCFFSGCPARWGNSIDQAIASWNAQDIAVEFDQQTASSTEHHVLIGVFDYILDDPGILGLQLPVDANQDLCLVPDCTVLRMN